MISHDFICHPVLEQTRDVIPFGVPTNWRAGGCRLHKGIAEGQLELEPGVARPPGQKHLKTGMEGWMVGV